MIDSSGSRRHLEFVLGTAQLRNAYGVTRASEGPPQAEDAAMLLRAAVAEHVEALDTAPAYGEAEATIGVASWTGSVHTKIDPGADPATSLATSLVRLQRNRVEVLYLHDATEILKPDSTVIAAAHRLVGKGVGLLGASICEVEEFDAAVTDPRIGAVQVPLNVFDRRIDDLRLAEAQARGILVYARGVLLQGVLLAPPERVNAVVAGLGAFVAEFQRIARSHDRSPLDMAVGWVRATPGIRGVVLGAESRADLHGLASALRSEPLDAAVLSELRSLGQPDRRLVDPRQWAKVV